MKICDTCDIEWPDDRFRADNPAPNTCFKCRASGVSLTLQGGKQYWNEDTERRRSDKALSEARAAGFEPVLAETRGGWNGASAAALSKIGDVSKKNGAFGKKATEPTGSVVSGSVASKVGAN
jgi:hypothetical protein